MYLKGVLVWSKNCSKNAFPGSDWIQHFIFYSLNNCSEDYNLWRKICSWTGEGNWNSCRISQAQTSWSCTVDPLIWPVRGGEFGVAPPLGGSKRRGRSNIERSNWTTIYFVRSSAIEKEFFTEAIVRLSVPCTAFVVGYRPVGITAYAQIADARVEWRQFHKK